MNDNDAEVAAAVAAIEAVAGHRWGAWRSDTGWWWAARTEPLSARDLDAGGVPFLHADSPEELTERIKEQDRLDHPRPPGGQAAAVIGAARPVSEAVAPRQASGRAGMTTGLPRRGSVWRALFAPSPAARGWPAGTPPPPCGRGAVPGPD